jgi:pimeloyl-ACP methyl ester carboxylesterase
MWGAHDSVLPLKEVRTKIQNLLPEARLFVFDKSGHLPHMEEEEKFNRILFEQILQ